MEKHSIQTPQNVTIDFEIASLGARLGGTLIDIAFIWALYYVLGFMFSPVISETEFSFTHFFVILPLFFYYFIINIVMNGQTIGKYLLKTRVIKTNGHELSLGDHVIRWLFWNFELAFFFGLIGLLSCLFTKRTQRLGDLAANAIIINIRPRTSLTDTLFENVTDAYLPTYPEVVHLKDGDVELVKEVIRLNSTTNTSVAKEALTKISSKIEKTLKIKRNGSDVQFLRTILMDYNYFTQKMD